MPTITISQKEYKVLKLRQIEFERELKALKRAVENVAEEAYIRPQILKRWERISLDLDRGKGHAFGSAKEMSKWLEKISRG